MTKKLILTGFFLLMILKPIHPAGVETIFQETFNNNNGGWTISDNPSFYSAILRGKYFVQHKTKAMDIFYSTNFTLDFWDEFTIEAVVEKKAGSDSGFYGLVFAYEESSKGGYFFNIKGDGYAAVNVLERGKWGKPVIDGPLERIVKKHNAKNRFSVVFLKNETHFFINNIFIGSVPRLKLKGRRIGTSVEDRIVMEVDAINVFRGVPRHLAGAIKSAKTHNDPGVMFYDMKILPYQVKAGKLFDFRVNFTVVDSQRDNQKLPVTLSYLIKKTKDVKKGKVLFKKSVKLKVDANENFMFNKSGLIAATRKGKYYLHVVIEYGTYWSTIIQPFEVK